MGESLYRDRVDIVVLVLILVLILVWFQIKSNRVVFYCAADGPYPCVCVCV